ncbi:MAG: ATP phosphoribosyltransferase [Chloroflexi bacterium]|nr:ATP phosphoribosyltransferase [Chloroflexota bacterium]
MGDRLRLAVPNKGRLLEPTVSLLHDAGLVFDSRERSLVSSCENFPLDILFARTEDIVEFVHDGVADMGITGRNLLVESGRELDVRAQLHYGRCRLEAAVPTDAPAQTIADLDGCRVATSHRATSERFFQDRGIRVEIVPLSGAVEVAPRMGLADAIVDLVSTGSTMLVNGLRSIGTLLASEAVLVAPPGADGHATDVVTMLQAVVDGRERRYVMMNAPLARLAEIEALLPGLGSPSIVPLARGDMVAVHAVVNGDELWGLLGSLKAAGASGILVLPIELLIQ